MPPLWFDAGEFTLHIYHREEHLLPHVAVRAGRKALGTVAIESGEVLAGTIPPKILRRVRTILNQNQRAALEAFAAGLAHGEVARLDVSLTDRRRTVMTEKDTEWTLVDVTAVRVLARYVLELTFDTGEVKVLDMEPLMTGPVFDALLADYDLFRQVQADPEVGTIVWPNGADWAPEELYRKAKAAIPV